MVSLKRGTPLALCASFVALTAPAGILAQEPIPQRTVPELGVEFWAGPFFESGSPAQFADETEGSYGVAVSVALTPRLRMRFDLNPAEQDNSGGIVHLLAGADYEILSPERRFGVRGYAGLGAAIVDGPRVRAPVSPGSFETFPLDINERWFELATGLEAHFRVHRFFEPFARVRTMVAFPGDEVWQFSLADPDAGDGPLWSFPLQLGLRANF